MRKYFALIVCFVLFSDVFGVGVPVRVIRCVDRSEVDDAQAAQKGQDLAFKMLDSTNITNQFCYPGEVTFDISLFDCTDPNIADEVITVRILGDTLITGDAMTINTISNAVFIDGSSSIADDFDPLAPVGTARIAVTAVMDGEIEVEFTRDPSQETVITFRNSATPELRIPACTPGDLAIGTAAAIPTIGEWAGIILAFLMMIFGVIAYKEKSSGTLIPVKERVKKS